MLAPRRVPVSRRDRPAKPPLTREGIVAVALRIEAEEGLDKVTMRRVATELDTGAASLYVYVQNTAELHGAILDELLATIDLTLDPDVLIGPGWRPRLLDLLVDYTTLLYSRPALARSVLVLRPTGPNYLHLLDAVLSLLAAGQVPVPRAAWGVDVLLQHATSTAAEHGTRDERGDDGVDFDAFAHALTSAAPQTYPAISRVAEHLMSGTGPQRLRWAFGVVVAGISVEPAPDEIANQG
ncbi:MAG: TetR/AcrR family transcriptional regulator [Janthinobacterium lividum]